MPNVPKYMDFVLRIMGREARFQGCREIHQKLEKAQAAVSDRPSLSTVYRTLHRMARDGLLDTIQSPEGERLYRRCQTSVHHHHLFCRVCGGVEEITEIAALAAAVEHIRNASGFEKVDHTFELSGICPRCL
ncbi:MULTISPECIES: Fur family transcriptional regulator [Nocardiopsis]|jgi:Fur family transcriptional regulator, ferric uptake regulator|uniref:Fur family transcriptional regulator n=1 Tax=Nocardiopsis TaxID=2013 RepID=UPI0003477A1B|nr:MULTISPECIES: transcriptional repressor [Nocardiopsis]PWV55411.1 Fur family ferric uptake transcriptional regulator [Nocardiopsis sp. L17-MgMaSL7]